MEERFGLPNHIKMQINHIDDGTYCLYLLYIGGTSDGSSIYKFGRTINLRSRLTTHYNNLRFKYIVGVFDCGNDELMKANETLLKKYAQSRDLLRPKDEFNERIVCKDISKVIKFIEAITKKVLINGMIDNDKICIQTSTKRKFDEISEDISTNNQLFEAIKRISELEHKLEIEKKISRELDDENKNVYMELAKKQKQIDELEQMLKVRELELKAREQTIKEGEKRMVEFERAFNDVIDASSK